MYDKGTEEGERWDQGEMRGGDEGRLSLENAVLALSVFAFQLPRNDTARALSLEKDLSTEKTSRFRVLGLHEERDYTLFRYRGGL